MDSGFPAVAPPGDELDLLALASYLWKRRFLILLCGVAAAASGILYGFVATPMYRAHAIISPKQQASSSGGSSALFSQLGGFSGVVAAQLGMGNADIGRLELMATSRDLAEYIVRNYDLLPRLFPKLWNPKTKSWARDPGPSARDGADHLQTNMLAVQVDLKKAALTLAVQAPDSTLAGQLVEYYLDALGKTIKMNVRSDADSNRNYLERQLSETTDPLLREKIQQLIGVEIEKAMLVSSKSFDVLERPVVPTAPFKPVKRKLAVISFLLGLVSACMFLVARKAFSENARRRTA